ncbi:hypothetical protein GCM10009612_22400 [Streptomyces beijiangensis]
MPTLIGVFFTPLSGNSCQAPTPTIANTTQNIRIRRRIDRIAALSSKTPPAYWRSPNHTGFFTGRGGLDSIPNR